MSRKKDFLSTAIEIGAFLFIGYTISKYFRIGLTRGSSMLPTFKHNQPIFLDCKCYRRRKPRRHDVIAFKCTTHKRKIYLKRVIGLPSEKIHIEEGNVYINDQILNEPYLKEPMKKSPKMEITVEAETLFVMGDNRNNSLDSRREAIGLIPIKDIIGVVKQCK